MSSDQEQDLEQDSEQEQSQEVASQEEDVEEEEVEEVEVATKTEKGVCYFPKIPPYMTPNNLRKLLSQRFQLARVYLEPEAEHIRKQRKKSGGNHKQRFNEGWVEFTDKKDAKLCALALNGTQIGGKKRHNLFYDDIWNIRYLPKFKWSNLTEKLAYDQKVREQRLKAETNQAKKEINFYMEKVDLKKKIDKMDEKKSKKLEKLQREHAADDDENNGDDGQEEGDEKQPHEKKKQKNLVKMMKYHQRKRREFVQREPVKN